MKMLTKEIENRLEKVGYGGKKNADGELLCQVKFFDCAKNRTWLVAGGERNDKYGWILYGKCNIGYGWEWGAVGLTQLEDVNTLSGWQRIQREKYESDGKHTISELSRGC